ncbi:Major facilitator superfamily protein [Rhynchospora pubera]|uniref:Major facilitator superfamily protein n=1 Tax=Rhynchospora pubera TaxID=906938 RepID=A0AAV8CFA6_9POAL|nr:Major facilitator superfamily protein [Rhynchospora pubera]
MVRVKEGSRPPWVGLGAAVWVEIAAGCAYTFPLYSHALKSALKLNQQQLTLLGVANDVGENFGLLPGVLCNRLAPWISLLIGAACSLVGFGAVWLAVSQVVPSMPYWLVWFALCVATNSSAWLGTAALVTNMRNFPFSRGTVAGILKGYIGLSAAVFTELYTGVLNHSSTKLLLFMTLGIPAICLLVMYFVRPCTPSLEDDSSEKGHFIFVQIMSVLLGLFLLTSTVLDDVLGLKRSITYLLSGFMILLILAPFAIPIKMTLYPVNKKRSDEDLPSQEESLLVPTESEANPTDPEIDDTSEDVDILLAEGEGAVQINKKKRKPRRGEDFNFRQALVKADFWLLFMVYFLGVGSGVTVLNNLAQIGIAAGVDDTTILLSVFSFCNFVGRLGGGGVSEYFVRTKMLPRPVLMTATQIIMVITYLLFASGFNGTLYASMALLGVCYGTQFSVMIPTASELFGLKHFGKIFNFMSLGNPLGAFLFSSILAGYVYDAEAAKQNPGYGINSSSATCLGPNCFRITLFVLAGLCALGTILSVILTVRIKPVYQMLYAGGSFRMSQSSGH